MVTLGNAFVLRVQAKAEPSNTRRFASVLPVIRGLSVCLEPIRNGRANTRPRRIEVVSGRLVSKTTSSHLL